MTLTELPVAPSTAPADVLATAWQVIVEHPELHSQKGYDLPSGDVAPGSLAWRNDCGTTHCLAGWMRVVHPSVTYSRVPDPGSHDGELYGLQILDQETGLTWESPWDWACDLLGVPEDGYASELLFSPVVTTKNLKVHVALALEALRAESSVEEILAEHQEEMLA